MSGTRVRAVLLWFLDGPWLTRERLLACCRVLLVLEAMTAAFFVAGTHGLIVPLPKPTSTDFVSFYAAGKLADSALPAQAYNPAAHWAMEQRIIGPGLPHSVFYYPPTFLLLCGPLAKLPYLAAFYTFELGTLFLCLLIACRILDARAASVLVPILAFPPLIWNFGLGQNAFLSTALLGGGTLLIERRPFAAGVLFGALCFKPHFGLVLPFALLAGWHWRALLGAAASAAVLVGLSVAVFGLETWQAFFAAANNAPAFYSSGHIAFHAMASVFGAARLIGLPAQAAEVSQIAATLLAILVVSLVWLRRASLSARASVLASAIALAAPLILFYDLMFNGVALLWLARAARETRWMHGERWALVLLYALTLVAQYVTQWSHVPVGLVATIVTFGWAKKRACREILFSKQSAKLTISQPHVGLIGVKGRATT